MNKLPQDPPDSTPPDDVLEQALASIQNVAVPAGPTPELIAATHQALWYPFQSEQVRDILRHMTPEETRQLTVYARKAGLIAGLVPSLIMYPLVGYLAFCTPLYPPRPWSVLVLVVLVIPVTFLIMWLGFSGIRRKQIQMLCETSYARQRGFAPRTLTLYALGRKKSNFVLIIVLTAMGLVPLSLLFSIGPFIPVVAEFLQAQRDDFQSRMILFRMSKVYANCKTYQDSGLVKQRFIRAGSETESEMPFTTAFVRHDRFRYEFSHKAGSTRDYRYIIWSDNKDVRSWWDVKPGSEKQPSLHRALGGATGVSGDSATTIPAFLLPWQVTPNLATTIAETKQVADESLNGIECICITGKYARHPITLWIDKKTYLIRQIHLRMQTRDFTSEQTTTYTPIVNETVPEQRLKFDPPVSK